MAIFADQLVAVWMSKNKAHIAKKRARDADIFLETNKDLKTPFTQNWGEFMGYLKRGQTLFLVWEKGANSFFFFWKKDGVFSLVFEKGGGKDLYRFLGDKKPSKNYRKPRFPL